MKIEGKNSLTLFNVECDLFKQVRNAQAEPLFQKLGLEMPKQKRQVMGLDLPLVPSQEDFFFFPFRHLSQTIVGGGTYKATDFSEGNVLKNSTKLLTNKKAYVNHDLCVGNEIGYVGDAVFTRAYKNENGDQIPGGIDAPFVIDSKLFPELVRKLSSPVSPIDSASVTVVYEWEASHEFEHDGDFYWHLGEMIDGEMVRRIAKAIIDYEESSLVWSGADPFAKMLNDNGEVVNIDRAAAFAKEKMEKYSDFIGKKYFVFDCLDSNKLLHLSKSSEQFSSSQKIKHPMKKELAEFLASIFTNVSAEKFMTSDFKKEDLQGFTVMVAADATKLKEDAGKVVTLENEKTQLTKQVSDLTVEKTNLENEKKTLETKITSNEELAKTGKSVLDKMKESALKLYGVFSRGKSDKTVEDEIKNATSYEKLETHVKLMGGKLVTEFGAHCAKCKSENIVFRSSVEDPEGGQGEKGDDVNLAEAFVK